MNPRLRLLILSVVLVAAAWLVPARSAWAGDVYVAMTITYYSDASHTTVVGVCSYPTCRYFVEGNQVCTGTTSNFGVGSNYQYCPPPE